MANCLSKKIILIEDTRNKIGKHNNIFKYCKEHDIEIQRKVLNVGDYMLPQGTIAVDTKQSLSELANDLYTDKLAFNKKYKKCLKDGIKLIVLVEEPIKDLNELVAWKSKHSRINGRLLLDMIHTIQASYGVKFVFCDKKNTGETLLKLLKGSKL